VFAHPGPRRLPVQGRLAEAQQEQQPGGGAGNRDHVGQARGRQAGQDTTEQGAAGERGAVPCLDPAEVPFVPVGAAGLLQQGVVDDRVDGPGLQREKDAENHRADDIAGHTGAHRADQHAEQRGSAGEHEHATPAPPVGEDAGRDLQHRHHRRVRGGHRGDQGRGEAELGHEDLLNRYPRRDTGDEQRELQRA
jgi:hypothetical protein